MELIHIFVNTVDVKISLNGHNKERCEAKMRMRNMEYKERMREKRDAQERYRMKVERKSERGSLAVF